MELPETYLYNKEGIKARVETIKRVKDYLTKAFLSVDNNVRFFRAYSSPDLSEAKKTHREKIRELVKDLEKLVS